MAGQKIKICVDECVPSGIISYLRNKFRAVSVVPGAPPRSSDDEVIRYASSKKSIVLTTNVKHFTLKKFQLCTHEGIIVIDRIPFEINEAIKGLKKFLHSGMRKHAKHAFTKIRGNHFEITRQDNSEIQTISD